MPRASRTDRTIDLDAIPTILSKIVGVIDQDVERIAKKAGLPPGPASKMKPRLTLVETKQLLAYADTLIGIYKDHRAEVTAIEREIKTMSPAEIAAIARAGV